MNASTIQANCAIAVPDTRDRDPKVGIVMRRSGRWKGRENGMTLCLFAFDVRLETVRTNLGLQE